MVKHLVNEYIGIPGGFDQIFAISRITANSQLMSSRLENETECRFDRLVFNLNHAHPTTGLFKNHTFCIQLVNLDLKRGQ
jgi:hypothetical protein